MTEAQEDASAAAPEAERPKPRRRGTGSREPIAKSSPLTGLYANLAAGYLQFVHATSPIVYEPSRLLDFAAGSAPFIVAVWHGQAFMMPFVVPKEFPIDVLASRHGDGERIARTFQKLGCGTVRGSGSRSAMKSSRKGGASAFIAMRRRLQAGVSIGLTADFDAKAPRQASLGVVMLAQASGRPIIPAAIATTRRIQLNNWDRTTINLPFSRAACVFGELVEVPASADKAMLEEKRLQLENTLNAVTARAYELAERRHG